MPNLAFEALGTAWSILIDAPASELSEAGADLETLRSELIALTDIFDHRFSRFKPDTEATAFRHADSGTYPISPEFTQLLARSDVLRQLTDGAFDPAVGGLLEAAGYDPQYQLKPDANSLATWKLPNWSVNTKDHTLTIDGPVVFDIGGTGKGYWIDVLSQYLLEKGFTYHLVEGGGDMKATTKANGDGYTIALEWPGRPDMAIGVVTLKNQGLAASDVFKR